MKPRHALPPTYGTRSWRGASPVPNHTPSATTFGDPAMNDSTAGEIRSDAVEGSQGPTDAHPLDPSGDPDVWTDPYTGERLISPTIREAIRRARFRLHPVAGEQSDSAFRDPSGIHPPPTDPGDPRPRGRGESRGRLVWVAPTASLNGTRDRLTGSPVALGPPPEFMSGLPSPFSTLAKFSFPLPSRDGAVGGESERGVGPRALRQGEKPLSAGGSFGVSPGPARPNAAPSIPIGPGRRGRTTKRRTP